MTSEAIVDVVIITEVILLDISDTTVLLAVTDEEASFNKADLVVWICVISGVVSIDMVEEETVEVITWVYEVRFLLL